ncbi:hypothetical protein ARMGADRAFT_569547 [Armillaria gallica]|uniref:Uncharacterized protein n=1 Tax=Armillaria gallica TaxID=47427 RepID=A0A2H3E9Z0_ARMGA|nr:hypothetical protein ARMGADRAFT_569547 [Armillaria gallica]
MTHSARQDTLLITVFDAPARLGKETTGRMFLVSTTAGQVLSVPFINKLDSIQRTLGHSDENRTQSAIKIDTFGGKPLLGTCPSAFPSCPRLKPRR